MVITFYIPAEIFSRTVEHPCQFWIGTLAFRLSIFGRRQQRIDKMTTALRKALGDTADRQPDIFRQALERFSPQLAKSLEEGYVEAYREGNEDNLEETQGAI